MIKLIKKIFSIIIFIINILAVIALILSYFAFFISPDSVPIIAFFGIAYPIILIINILFVIYWIIRLKFTFLISFIAIIIGYKNISTILQFNNNKINITQADNIIKVMSYNVRYFNYEITKEKNNKRDSIIDYLKNEHPDILCIQEYYSAKKKKKFNITDTLKKINNNKYAYILYFQKKEIEHNYGMAIFSKFPIINKGAINFKSYGTNNCIFADLLINNDTIRVYNAHLESIRFGAEDYLFVDDLSNKDTKDIKIESNFKRIINKLKKAFIKRCPQVRLLSESIKKSKYPVIVCGDFNDTPSSYTYYQIALRNKLKDAFVESGKGIAHTYNGIFPSFKIDYILYSPKFKSYNFTITKNNLSDHYPINCYINLNFKK
jgi:endonuclease/exonuclease/phosphatase family metal-dependent hydrolase